jgi:hypothetical protein
MQALIIFHLVWRVWLLLNWRGQRLCVSPLAARHFTRQFSERTGGHDIGAEIQLARGNPDDRDQ